MEKTLKLTINNKGVISGIKSVRKSLKTLGKTTKKLGKSIVKMTKRTGRAFKTLAASIRKNALSLRTTILGLAGAAGFGLLVKSTLDTIDRIGKLSTITGISTETLGTLSLAANLAGTDLESVAQASLKLGKNLNEFLVRNSGEAKRAFEQLGLGMKDFEGIGNDVESQLAVIADKFQAMPDGATKAALAMEIFGRAGAKLIPLLNQGSEGIEALKLEAESMGLTLSRQVVLGVEKANDAMTRLGTRIKGTFQNIIAANAPDIEKLADTLSKSLKDFIDGAGGPKQVGLDIASAFVDIGAGISKFFVEAIANIQKLSQVAVQAFGVLKGKTFFDFDENEGDTVNQLKDINANITIIKKNMDDVGFFAQFNNTEFDNMRDNLLALESQRITTESLLHNIRTGIRRSEVIDDKATIKAIEKFRMESQKAIEAQRTAEPTTPTVTGGAGNGSGDGQTDFDVATLDKLRQSLLSQEELVRQSFVNRITIAREAVAHQAITEADFSNLVIQLTTQRDMKLAELGKVERERKEADASAELLSMSIKREQELVGISLAEQTLLDALARRQEIITNNEMNGEISTLVARDRQIAAAQAFEDNLTALTNKGQTDRQKFAELSAAGQFKNVMGFLAATTAGAARENKKLFMVNKVASASSAGIATYEAINETLSAYPYPLNFGLAAIVGAAGFANVASIASASFGGGGSGSSNLSGGGGGSVPSQLPTVPDNIFNQEATVQRDIVVNLSLVDQSENVLSTIQERVNNGGEVLFDPTSQQAISIRQGEV